MKEISSSYCRVINHSLFSVVQVPNCKDIVIVQCSYQLGHGSKLQLGHRNTFVIMYVYRDFVRVSDMHKWRNQMKKTCLLKKWMLKESNCKPFLFLYFDKYILHCRVKTHELYMNICIKLDSKKLNSIELDDVWHGCWRTSPCPSLCDPGRAVLTLSFLRWSSKLLWTAC